MDVSVTLWPYIFYQTTPQPLPTVPSDQALERLAQLLRVQHVVEDQRHGHVVPLHQQAILEEVERHHLVGRLPARCRWLTPEQLVHLCFFLFFSPFLVLLL